MFHVEPCRPDNRPWWVIVSMFHVEHNGVSCRRAGLDVFHVEHSLTGGWVNDTVGGSSPVLVAVTVHRARPGCLHW